jgi:signal transduction histidine kinase
VRIDQLIVHRPLLFAVAVISTIAIGAVISFSMFYCYMLERAWVNITDDFKRELHAHDAAPPSDHFSRLGNFDLYEITYTQNGRTHVIGVAPLPDEMPRNAITSFDTAHDHALFAFDETAALLTSIRSGPIALIGAFDDERASFIIDKSQILHDAMDYSFVLLLAIFLAVPLIITIGLLFVRRAEQRLIGDLIKTIYMMADDPTVTQPMPVSMRAARNFAELVQALELLQLNMVRTLQHRERLAEIGEGVAKINHDIRNVLSSATLVSDALLASDDDNVRKSAPLVLRSLQQAVDLCQSMLDYLAQTPAPVYADFDLINLLEEVKTATLLDIDFSGPTTMHADRGMMFRILLNLGRNAGAAGASKLTIEIWRAGHLAIFDISDNGSGIPRHLWPTLFSPFKSRQSSGGGLGLTIARDLALAQDGILKLSRSSDIGSEFRIQFSQSKFPELQADGTASSMPTITIGTRPDEDQ